MCVIYSVTSPSGKSYIGQTRQGPDIRWRKHCSDARNNNGCPLLGAAIRRYGKDNFTHKILEVCNLETIDDRERFWIQELNTCYPEGYNILIGGQGGQKFEKCVPDADVSASQVDRVSLPLYINFMYCRRGYHSYIVRNCSKNGSIPEKAFRSGKTSLSDTLKKAEVYLEQYIPREQWIYENKKSVAHSVKLYAEEDISVINRDSLPKYIYLNTTKDIRPSFNVRDGSTKNPRFQSKTFRSGKKSLNECLKQAEDYLALFVPREQWVLKKNLLQNKVQRLNGGGFLEIEA